MGAAWCRDRAVKAQDSKSPFDRVIVKCVNQMSLSETHNVTPVSSASQIHSRSMNVSGKNTSEWQEVVLSVPDLPDKAPMPPPRKKKLNRVNQPMETPTKVEEIVLKTIPTPRKKPAPTLETLIRPHPYTEVVETPTPLVDDAPIASPRSEAVVSSTSPSLTKKINAPLTSTRKTSAPVSSTRKTSDVSSSKVTPVEKPPTPDTQKSFLEVDSLMSKTKSRSLSCLPYTNSKERMADGDSDLLYPTRRVSSSLSTSSRGRSVTPVSDATTERLDNYLKSCRSFGSLKPEELLNEINQANSDDSSDSDAWAGLDDWDLGIVEHYDARTGTPPLTPTSQLSERRGRRAEFTLGGLQKKETDVKQPVEPRKKRRTHHKPKSDTNNKDNTAHSPAKFQTNPSSDDKPTNNLIKPSHIPVHDFLRQSGETSSLHEKRKFNLKVDVPSDNQSFSFDFTKGLVPPRSPQIEIPGTPNSPRALSRCSSPLPKQLSSLQQTSTPPSSPTTGETENPYEWQAGEQETQSNLLKLLNEYHAAAEIIGDEDAKKILLNLGIPESLTDDTSLKTTDKEVEALVDSQINNMSSNVSSGRSSMTQSLTELEAALSDLLEASAGKDDDEDDQEIKMESTFTPIKQEPVHVAIVPQPNRKIAREEHTVERIKSSEESVERIAAKDEVKVSAFTPIAQEVLESKKMLDEMRNTIIVKRDCHHMSSLKEEDVKIETPTQAKENGEKNKERKIEKCVTPEITITIVPDDKIEEEKVKPHIEMTFTPIADNNRGHKESKAVETA